MSAQNTPPVKLASDFRCPTDPPIPNDFGNGGEVQALREADWGDAQVGCLLALTAAATERREHAIGFAIAALRRLAALHDCAGMVADLDGLLSWLPHAAFESRMATKYRVDPDGKPLAR